MNIAYINPFIQAAEETFHTMCKVMIERDGKLRIRQNGLSPAYDLIGTIGLQGAVKGAVLMTMPTAVGRKVVKQFLDEKVITDNDLFDGFGELLNIISGAASAHLGRVQLALPTVIIGTDRKIHSPGSTPWIIIPMKFPEWGEFTIEVAIQEGE